jgi:long-chain acyl-CoA synthetase
MRSQALMQGYYKEPGKTRPRPSPTDGWLRTGDKGSIDAQGNCCASPAG